MSDNELCRLKVTVGENHDVTCCIDESPNVIVAKALLMEGSCDAPTRIVLDRAVHATGTSEYSEWFVSGVVSDLRRKGKQ